MKADATLEAVMKKASELIRDLTKERDEAREYACKLLYIAECRGPRVFGPRPDWLKVKE